MEATVLGAHPDLWTAESAPSGQNSKGLIGKKESIKGKRIQRNKDRAAIRGDLVNPRENQKGQEAKRGNKSFKTEVFKTQAKRDSE